MCVYICVSIHRRIYLSPLKYGFLFMAWYGIALVMFGWFYSTVWIFAKY